MIAEEKEIWKKIPGFPAYSISNTGKVISYKGKGGGKILTPRKTTQGRHQVCLSEGGKTRNFLVHRLVYLTFNNKGLNFIGYNEKACVCHKDDNPDNNYLDNLFIGTQRDNLEDARKKGRMVNKKKELDDYTEGAIKVLLKNRYSAKGISRLMNVSIRLINRIKLKQF